MRIQFLGTTQEAVTYRMWGIKQTQEQFAVLISLVQHKRIKHRRRLTKTG